MHHRIFLPHNYRHRHAAVFAVIALLSFTRLGLAGEATASKVVHDNGRFTVHSNILLNLPEVQVREILTDHTNLPRINKSIVNVRLLTPDQDGTMRMRLNSKVCVLFMCKNYQWVQTVIELPNGDIVTKFDPQLSDFQIGWVRYRILPEGSKTRLITDAVLQPDFWFPPLVGHVLIKSKLNSEALVTASRIETIAPQAGVRVAYNGD